MVAAGKPRATKTPLCHWEAVLGEQGDGKPRSGESLCSCPESFSASFSGRRGEERGRGGAEASGLGAAGAHRVQRAGLPPAQLPGRQTHTSPVHQDQGEEPQGNRR